MMTKLFMLYAILIFAKRAPKLISELLKLKGDGVGLKGLNIKNKMGEAALVGDKVKKGMTKAEGGIRGAAGGAFGGGVGAFGQGFKNTKGGLKDKLVGGAKAGGKGFGKGFITGGKNGIAAGAASKDGNLKGVMTKNYKQSGQVARGGADSLLQRGKNKVNSVGEKISAKGYNSLQIARSNEAEKFKGELRGVFGAKGQDSIISELMKKNYNGKTGADIFNDADAYEAFKQDLKGIRGATNPADITKTGIPANLASNLINNEADGLSLMENIYKERQKKLNNIQELYQRYQSLDASDPLREQVKNQLQTEIVNNAQLFSANAGNGRNLGIEAIGPANPSNADACVEWVATDTKTVKKNDKALSDVQKDIQARNSVEAESGTKKEG